MSWFDVFTTRYLTESERQCYVESDVEEKERYSSSPFDVRLNDWWYNFKSNKERE